MDNDALQRYLRDLFAGHEVDLEPDEDGWLLTDGDFPAIRASWHEGTVDAPGRLDIDVVLAEEHTIEESYAGEGSGEAACRDALAAFEHGALHVLLAACWYTTDERKLGIAAWEIGMRTWDVFTGPWVLGGADGNDVSPPAGVTDVIKAALERESLAPHPHALRLFVERSTDGEPVAEALLDNAPWAPGTRALLEAGWSTAIDAYRAHRLMVLDVRDY